VHSLPDRGRVLFLASALFSAISGTPAGHAADPVEAAPSKEVILDLGGTRYLGLSVADGAIESFRGIPFAAPPTGSRRWAPPAPAEPVAGDVEAARYAPACVQGGYMADWYAGVAESFGGSRDDIVKPHEDEDCLYLNLWRPRDREDGPLPALVYIHGGGNSGGWSWEPNYDGTQLARRGLVVISIAYRLGVFGYFSHPDLDHANFGLLDQVAALDWIRGNADALGIDPGRVTVMGESSGGNNIVHLLVMPQARGRFQRAIVQSAGWALQDTAPKPAQEARALELERVLLGATGDLDALRAVPAAELFAAAGDVYKDHFFDPVIDGQTILEPVGTSVSAGRMALVDLLIGSNADEWKMYLAEDATLGDWVEEGLPEARREAAEPLLRGHEDPRQALDRAVTAHQMVCPSLALADAVQRRGGRSWAYWFTRVRPGELAAEMGAYHGAELPYLFDTHDDWLPTAAEDRSLTSTMMSYWTTFAATGDPNPEAPNGAGIPSWPAYAGGGANVQRLDTAIGAVHHPEWPLCALLGVKAQHGP
jgi:para-nitrobenzyl esterase